MEKITKEIDLDLFAIQNPDVDKENIEERRKQITQGYLKCEKCGKTYGALVKTDTGYAHKNCKEDTYSYMKNVVQL